MKAFEYKRILEEHAETSLTDEVKAAYRLALAMFLMVEIGKPDGNAAESAEPAWKADGGGTRAAAGEETGGVKAGEDETLRKEGYRKKYAYKPKECKNCGETFTPHYGSQTLCMECARTIDRLAEVKPKKSKALKLSDPEYRRKMAEDLAKG